MDQAIIELDEEHEDVSEMDAFVEFMIGKGARTDKLKKVTLHKKKTVLKPMMMGDDSPDVAEKKDPLAQTAISGVESVASFDNMNSLLA